MMKKFILSLIATLGIVTGAQAAGGGAVAWDKAPVDVSNQASLQNGAKLFVNYCLSCHSAAFMRFNRLQDIGLSEQEIKDNLLFTTDKIGETMIAAIDPKQAKSWFGANPPDLTVIARSRAGSGGSGADYLYTFLRTFYRDETKKLDERETGIAASEADVKGRLDEINGKIEAGGQAQYKEKAAQPDPQTKESLVAWNTRLENKDKELKQFEGQLKTKEAGLNDQIVKESDAKFAKDRVPVEQRYDGLQGQLNAKETDLNSRKNSIDTKIQQGTDSGVAAQKPGLQQDLRYAQQERDRAQQDASEANLAKGNASTQLSSAQSQYNSARQEAESNQGRVNKLNNAIRDLSNQQDNLRAEHHQADSTHSKLQSDLTACRNS